jgi:hypothetical protein
MKNQRSLLRKRKDLEGSEVPAVKRIKKPKHNKNSPKIGELVEEEDPLIAAEEKDIKRLEKLLGITKG